MDGAGCFLRWRRCICRFLRCLYLEREEGSVSIALSSSCTRLPHRAPVARPGPVDSETHDGMLRDETRHLVSTAARGVQNIAGDASTRHSPAAVDGNCRRRHRHRPQ